MRRGGFTGDWSTAMHPTPPRAERQPHRRTASDTSGGSLPAAAASVKGRVGRGGEIGREMAARRPRARVEGSGGLCCVSRINKAKSGGGGGGRGARAAEVLGEREGAGRGGAGGRWGEEGWREEGEGSGGERGEDEGREVSGRGRGREEEENRPPHSLSLSLPDESEFCGRQGAGRSAALPAGAALRQQLHQLPPRG